jgi:hypothetical protein
MGFFSSDLGLAEQFANPKVSRIYQPSGGNQPLSSSVFSDNPFEALTQAISGGTGGTSGGFNMPWSPDLGDGTAPVNPINPVTPVNPDQPPSGPENVFGTDYSSSWADDSSNPVTGEFDLRDYLENRTTQQGMLGLFGALAGIPGLGMLADYNAGINPLSSFGGDTFLDSFGEKAGLTSDYFSGYDFTDLTGEQRDMLTEQLMFNAPTAIDQAWYENLFDNIFGTGISLDYDPALDLTIGDWEGWESDTPDAYGGVSAGEMLDAGFTTEDIDFIGSGLADFNNEPTIDDLMSGMGDAGSIDSGSSSDFGDYSGDMGSISTDGQGGATYSSEATGDVSGTDYGGGSYGFTDVGGYDVGYESPGGDDGGGDSGGGGGSYIATAATQALGEKGLKVFEDWRDYMFAVLPTFTSSFGRYRATAPKIVAEIDKKENSKNIYSWIWDMHLKPIFDLIREDKDSEKALKDYKIMVRELSNKFLKKEKV